MFQRSSIALLFLSLSGCAATAASSTVDACTMSLTQQAVDHVGPLEIAVFSPPVYCVDPSHQADTSPYNGEARITNTSQSEVEINYASGNSAFLAFHSTALWQASDKASAVYYAVPPLSPTDIEVSTVILKPGQSLTLSSWSRHQDTIEKMVLADKTHATQHLIVEYAYYFQMNGQTVSGNKQTRTTAESARN